MYKWIGAQSFSCGTNFSASKYSSSFSSRIFSPSSANVFSERFVFVWFWYSELLWQIFCCRRLFPPFRHFCRNFKSTVGNHCPRHRDIVKCFFIECRHVEQNEQEWNPFSIENSDATHDHLCQLHNDIQWRSVGLLLLHSIHVDAKEFSRLRFAFIHFRMSN